MLALWGLSMRFLLRTWHLRETDSFECFTMAMDFVCQNVGKVGSGSFSELQRQKHTRSVENTPVDGHVCTWPLPPTCRSVKACVCIVRVQWDGFHWPWSVGGGGWEAAEGSAAAVSCGQIGAPSYLLCTADILAQWAISTPQHSVHMGQKTELQTSLSLSLSFIPSLSTSFFSV